MGRGSPWAGTIATLQGTWYAVTGLWPWVSMRSFERITGTKQDRWLVRSFEVLVAAVGLVLVTDARRPDRDPAGRARLGTAAAAAIAFADGFHVLRGETSRDVVYALDALLEAAFVVTWMTSDE